MSKKEIVEKLLEEDEEFNQIYSEHRELDEVVKNLERKDTLTIEPFGFCTNFRYIKSKLFF